MRGQHGGPRPNSGRKTRYAHKLKMPQSFTMTQKAIDAIGRAAARTGSSESDIATYLGEVFAPKIKTGDLPPLPEPSAA